MDILDFETIFCCPACHQSLTQTDSELVCSACSSRFPIVDGIPSLFLQNDWPESADVTDTIGDFYEQTPFPNYDDLDDAARLIEKAREGMLARLLDEQLPMGERILEAGCGTGQLTNFLSIANRKVFGADLSMSSLRLAVDFKERNRLKRAQFLRMNLFRPCFLPESFDLVVSNGVLHHTSRPKLAVETLSRLVKPGGYLVVGLYHRYGRLATDLRRLIFRHLGGSFRFLDGRLLDSSLNEKRQQAWFNDQYRNPHESKHTIAEVRDWLGDSGLTFVRSLPSSTWNQQANVRIFEPEQSSSRPALGMKELSMAFWPGQIREGGFFVVVCRKSRYQGEEIPQ